ncbi:MAG: hypothetical protein RLZZ127_2396, partial [Planctomycetota bacterium]
IAVFAGSRMHQIDDDGRPLAPSVAFPLDIERAGWTADGRFAAAARMESPDALTRRVRVAVRAVGEGAILLDQAAGAVPGDYTASEVAIAGDGSAAAVQIANHPLGQPRVAILRADGMNQVLPDLRDPVAVGSRGGWVIARPAGEHRLVLVRGPERTPLLAAAPGPAWTAIISEQDRRLQLLAPDGAVREVVPAIGIGNDPRLDVRGRWLVLHSGGGARTLPGRDALDREVPGGQPQPPTLAAWRTADLADPAAAPRLVRPMPWSPAAHAVAGWYGWDGASAWITDLSGEEPVDRPLPSTGAAVAWIDTDLGVFARIRRQDGTVTLVDRSGRTWFQGPGAQIWAQDQSQAIVAVDGDGIRSWSLAALHIDPAKRGTVPLQLDAGGWDEIYADRHDRRIVATSNPRGIWVELDPATGKERRRGSTTNPATPRPDVSRLWGTPQGRWQSWHGRLLDKADGETLLAAGRLWAPRDAWRMDRTVIAVTHDWRVAMSGRKPGEWLDLGLVDRGEPWLGLRRQRAEQVVVRVNGQTSHELAPGPRLAAVTGVESDDLPEGAWRVRGHRVTAPRQGDLVWDDAKAGFTPERLRGPYPDRLLAITPSLIISLDPGVLRLVFRPER